MRGKSINVWRRWKRYLNNLVISKAGKADFSPKPYLVALLYLGVGLGAVALALGKSVLPAYGEIRFLHHEQVRKAGAVQKIQQFAASHEDYEAFVGTKNKQLGNLRSKLPLFKDANQAQSRLQQLAARHGLMVQQLQLVEGEYDLPMKKPNQRLKQAEHTNRPDLPNLDQAKIADFSSSTVFQSRQLHMELAGDYFALVRWLKQVEKQHVQVIRMEIKGNNMGMVQAALTLRCFLMHNLGDKE